MINDYYKILIIKKAPNNFVDYLNKNILDFFKILSTLILDQNEENNLQFVNIILWFESYSDYIFPLIPLINIMNTLDDSFNKSIDNKINGMLKDNIKNIDKIKKNIKIILYLLYENILSYIFETSSHLFKNRKNDFEKFINILENSSFFIIQANMVMKLGLKHIYNLNSFIKFKTYIEEKENNTEILISYLSCLESDVDFSIMNQNKIILMLENEIKLIENEIKDDKKYDLLIELFSNKIIMVEEVNHKIDSNDNKKENLKISINNYFLNNDDLLSNNDDPENSKIEIEQTLLYLKQFILEKILQDPKLIIRSNYILQLIFNKSNLIPEIPDKILYKSEKDKILNQYPKIKKIDDTLLYILKSNESDFLEEIIIQLFESSFAYYFSEIKKKKNITRIEDDYFVISLKYIETSNLKSEKNHKIFFLYHITYLKSFCFEIVNRISMMTLEDKEKIEKLSKILTSNNYPFRKTIKLYILKVINDLYCKDYNEFKHFYYEDIGIKWIDEFDIYTPDIKFLNFLFLDINNIEDYLILKREINFTHFKTQSQQIISLINNKGFMTLFNLILNEYVSKISDKEFQNKKYKEFTLNFNQKISLFSELTENSKRILSQFLDYYKYRINPIFDYLSSNEEIEILLFAYKFAFICSLSNEDSFYYKLTSQNIENIIKTNYIPGGEPNDDLIIQNANQVERHLIETNNTSPGAYVCSCGYFYTIGECSLPTVISPCPICGEKIGGLDHKLVERNNHFRVFKNQQQFDELSKRSYYKSLNYMLLSDFKVMIEQKKKTRLYWS